MLSEGVQSCTGDNHVNAKALSRDLSQSESAELRGGVVWQVGLWGLRCKLL